MTDQIRDIFQLRENPPFSDNAVREFLALEAELKECLGFVPFCVEHNAVWSSKFGKIIVESASQLDSIWKATAVQNDADVNNEKSSLRKHFDRFGIFVEQQSLVLFDQGVGTLITPFCSWQGGFSNPAWWDAYNALKHDRFSNQTSGTLSFAVESLSALFLAIIYSGTCDIGLINAQLLDSSNYNPWAFAQTIREIPIDCRTVIESELFAHPLGVFGKKGLTISNSWHSNSPRFNAWWALNAHLFTGAEPPPIHRRVESN